MENKQIGKDLFILTNKLKRLLDKEHSKNGLFAGQTRVLTYLYKHKEKVTYQKDLEKAFQIRGGTVTGMLDSLFNYGYLTREESIIDKRKKRIVLTNKGEEMALIGIKTTTNLEKSLSGLLSKEEKVIFKNIINKIGLWIDGEEVKWEIYLNILKQ